MIGDSVYDCQHLTGRNPNGCVCADTSNRSGAPRQAPLSLVLYSDVMKVLAVDYGRKRIGIAVSDADGRIAFPVDTVAAGGSLAASVEAVARHVDRERVAQVIVGLPLAMDGSLGPASRHCQRFADALAARVAVPVRTWDERFSTRQAERSLLEADVRRERRKEVIDQVAATLILQSFLDANTAAEPTRSPG